MVTKLRISEAKTLTNILIAFDIIEKPIISHDDLHDVETMLQAEARQRNYTRALRIIDLVFTNNPRVTQRRLSIGAVAYEHPIKPRAEAERTTSAT